MHDMAAPEQIYFMTHSMSPIVCQINEQKKYEPIVPRRLEREECELLEKDGINANTQKSQEQTR